MASNGKGGGNYGVIVKKKIFLHLYKYYMGEFYFDYQLVLLSDCIFYDICFVHELFKLSYFELLWECTEEYSSALLWRFRPSVKPHPTGFWQYVDAGSIQPKHCEK